MAALPSTLDIKQAISRLYGTYCPDYEARIRELARRHLQETGETRAYMFSSPGRIELLGNHTDHQHGKVLCASINLDTLAAVTPRPDGIIRVHSGDYPIIEMRIQSTQLVPEEAGTSVALIRGILRYFADHGYAIGGFSATMTSNVARGSGVSSSASFECAITAILNHFYNNDALTPIQMAMAAQWSESVYFGKPCGLLDQSAIALGGVAYIDFADPADPVVEKVDWKLPYEVVLINSGGDHCKLTHCYADIKSEMEQVAQLFGGKVLGDVQPQQLVETALKAGVSGRAILRALHYYRENARVLEAKDALLMGDATRFMACIDASGYSSQNYLQNLFVPGDDSQPIPASIELARALGCVSARVHGGGFAGTSLAFFEADKVQQATSMLSAIYGTENVYHVLIREDGAVFTGIVL